MASFIMIISAFVLSKCLFVTALRQCSTDGIRGLAGCECKFVGACDVHETHRPGLDITQHLPIGLQLYGHRQSAIADRNLAYLCEGQTVAVLFDCNNRVPLYAATLITGRQLNGADYGGRPPGTAGTFVANRSKLPEYFQQSADDYEQASKRKICYKKENDPREFIDNKWYKAKNLADLPSVNVDCRSKSADKVETKIHRGHLIASRYGRGDQRKKEATFVFTNAVPQFGDFNFAPWNKCEGRLIRWGQNNCASQGTPQSVRMFIVVVAIPSTFFGPPETRYFGESGFSDYQYREEFRANVPKEMWTAACCTFQYKDDGRAGTKSMAFWRENVPGKLPCNRLKVNEMEERLKQRVKAEINLFPFHSPCRDENNYISLP